MPGKRSNGEGTLRKRPNGLWECTMMVGYQEDGRRRYKSFYGKTQKEARDKAEAYKRDTAAGLYIDPNLTFQEWAQKWYEGYKMCIRDRVWNLQQAKEVLETVDRPNAGMLVDTLHAHRSKVTVEEIDDCPHKWFEFAHICGGPQEIPDRSDTQALIHNGREARYYLNDPDNGVAVSYTHLDVYKRQN